MLTAEDRKIRVVDSSLELLAQGIGNAISDRFTRKSIEQMLENSLNVKIHQRELFRAAASEATRVPRGGCARGGLPSEVSEDAPRMACRGPRCQPAARLRLRGRRVRAIDRGGERS
jgi:hypothetical protein